MPIYKQHLAYTEINNDQAFTVTVPTLFSMQRGDRQEVLSMFKEFGGKWNASGQFWVFSKSQQNTLLQTMKFYNLVPTQKFSPQQMVATSKPSPIINIPSASVILSTPKTIAKSTPKVVAPPKPNLVTDILTLQKEFQRLHAATGLNKTSMIQILRAAVPAIVPTGFVKS
jgi:hypothetical protein